MSRLLDRYEDIGVSIESPFPDGILYRELVIKNAYDVDNKLKRLFNVKFLSWGIDKAALKNVILKRGGFPIKFRNIFPEILELYFKNIKPRSSVYIYKTSWNYLINFTKVSERYPDSKFIFIIRDGRAIYNSQKRSLESIRLSPMSNNPIGTARMFNKAVANLVRLKGNNNLYIIKYEEMIINTDREILRLLNFLGVDGNLKSDDNYFEKIPPSQKHLHGNLNRPPLHERISAWKKDLTKQEIFVFQMIAKKSLKAFGYDLENIEFKFITKVAIVIKYYLHYFLIRSKDRLGALFNPKYLVDRIWYRIHKEKK